MSAEWRFDAIGAPMLDEYVRLGRATAGAVNPLVGASLERLGYDATYSLTPGEPVAAPHDWEARLTWRGELRLDGAGTIDVGALGKGRLVDLVAAAIGGASVVDASGDIRVSGGRRSPRPALRLTLVGGRMLTPTVRELAFTARGPVRFAAGQYLELQVPHRGADARGTRREFSIVSAPSDLPAVRIAFRNAGDRASTYKRALATRRPGDVFAATGIWGDFVLPRRPDPLLLVAAGIGVTPVRVAAARAARAGR